MTVVVKAEKIGKKLNRLSIFFKGELIGEYERSQDADIQRKTAEVEAAQDLLLKIYCEEGLFIVRWNSKVRKKLVTVKGQLVDEIPKAMWRKPSWEKQNISD